MKKTFCLLTGLYVLMSCQPGDHSNQFPISIDPSDLYITDAQQESFEQRRERVLDILGNSVVLLRSGTGENDNRHRFRPNNYFYYLTGYDAPGALMVLSTGTSPGFTLVMPRETTRTLIYEGGNLSREKVQELYRPDRVLEFGKRDSMLREIMKEGRVIYTDPTDRTFLDYLEMTAGFAQSTGIRHIGELVDELRVIKDPWEIHLLQKACDITAQSLINVMYACNPGRYEFEMESIIEGTFLAFGAAMPGFPSIVGSGPNSTILHYEANNRNMVPGDLLLMDIGAEYGYYSADITRTIPVNGSFTPEQKTIYRLVLEAQKAAIDQLKPGNMIGEGHRAACRVILDGLIELGLVTDQNALWQQRFYILYPSTHYLGMDVHDVGDYGGFFKNFKQKPDGEELESRVLEPGMVLTIEPGLYFRANGLEQVQKLFGEEADSVAMADFIRQVSPVYNRYLHIGVRIEDDILITQEGNVVLSRHAPKEISEIEALMR